MNCTKCGLELNKNAEFCRSCGNEVNPLSKMNSLQEERRTFLDKVDNFFRLSVGKDYTKNAHNVLGWLLTLLLILTLLEAPSLLNNDQDLSSYNWINTIFDSFTTIVLGVFGLLYLIKKKENYSALRVLVVVFFLIDVFTELYVYNWAGAVSDLFAWLGVYLLALDTVVIRKFNLAVFLIVGSVAISAYAMPVTESTNTNLNLNYSPSSYFSDSKNKDCNVAGVYLKGTLIPYIPSHSANDSSYEFNFNVVSSENVVQLIKDANLNPKIQAIVLDVDSPGGSSYAGEEILIAVNKSQKPVIALIRELGASAAYWAISGSDVIFASKNSNVGAIGVSSSYLTNVSKNEREGYEYEKIVAGKYKDYGSPNKPLTPEERKILQDDVDVVYTNFTESISKNRGISLDKVKELSNGVSYMGEKARELGLIDEIGGLYDVEDYLEKSLGSAPSICW